jgi:hypothetical protein
MATKQWVLSAQGKAGRKAEPKVDQYLMLRSRAPKILQGLRPPHKQNSEREICLRCNGILLKLSKQRFPFSCLRIGPSNQSRMEI